MTVSHGPEGGLSNVGLGKRLSLGRRKGLGGDREKALCGPLGPGCAGRAGSWVPGSRAFYLSGRQGWVLAKEPESLRYPLRTRHVAGTGTLRRREAHCAPSSSFVMVGDGQGPSLRVQGQ